MRNKLVLGLLMLAVVFLHQDSWNWMKSEPLFLGFLPVGLAYHAGYCVLAAMLMAILVEFAWPADLDRMESGDENDDKKPTS